MRQKGTPKTGGRQPGSPNKITADLRTKINDFLGDNWDNLQADFDKLEPRDRLMFYEKLLQYGLPKLQSSSIDMKPDWTEHKKMLAAIFPTEEELKMINNLEKEMFLTDNGKLITKEVQEQYLPDAIISKNVSKQFPDEYRNKPVIR